MDEPPLILFEHDLAMDHGVRLVVTPTVLLPEGVPATRFEINVDDQHILAAYIGPKDIEHLIAFLERNKR